MTKRMLIDDTHPEETRVVVVNGNKVEDVEFESSSRKQIKGNIYLAKVMRIEPSLQAAFVDYGGNKHGFLAFGEIHPDYYTISPEEMAEVDKEVEDIIEAKKKAIKDREEHREKQRLERAAKQAARAEAEKQKDLEESQTSEESTQTEENQVQEVSAAPEEKKRGSKRNSRRRTKTTTQPVKDEQSNNAETAEVQATASVETAPEANNIAAEAETAATPVETNVEVNTEASSAEDAKPRKKRIVKKRQLKKQGEEKTSELKVLSEATGIEEDSVQEEDYSNKNDEEENEKPNKKHDNFNEDDVADDDEDDDEAQECDFELQKKLLKVRKLFHRSNIQDVIKEGQILIVQVVKEERGNKGAALTTYLSLAGRYCVLMPNRIKSGGVSRKITNANDRKRLKTIVRDLPLTSDMSMIVRTAGEDKTKADIVRDYNYLIRSWNQLRIESLKSKAPALIHEEGNLIKRALRDMYTKEISEIIVDGDNAYKMARDFVKILSPHNLKKIKASKKEEIPLFQRFQVETQLDKLHDATVQLESGGYLVINPTEALVSIDVNSGRATKEKDLEETALKTNLEAADEIAKQLRMRNLAGLVVIDFIDMEEPQNNHAVEKRMKEAMKKDRARVQIAKMSCFGLLEISRQRMHSSFMESNYQVCPHCRGQGVVRTIESGAVLILRTIEEEGIKGRSSRINVSVPSDVAVYLLNQKRRTLCEFEQRYNMEVVICADGSIKNVAEFKVERVKSVKGAEDDKKSDSNGDAQSSQNRENGRDRNRDNRENRGRDRNRDRDRNRRNNNGENGQERVVAEKAEVPVAQNAPTVEVSVADNSSQENTTVSTEENGENGNFRNGRRRDRRRGRDRNRDRNRDHRNNGENSDRNNGNKDNRREKAETVILYNSHEDTRSNNNGQESDDKQGKSNWWRKLIG